MHDDSVKIEQPRITQDAQHLSYSWSLKFNRSMRRPIIRLTSAYTKVLMVDFQKCDLNGQYHINGSVSFVTGPLISPRPLASACLAY